MQRVLSANSYTASRTSCAALAASIFLSFLLFFILTSRAQAEVWSAFSDMPRLSYVTEALAMDADGTVLFTMNADTPMAMASTTKIMTAVCALESGLSLDTVYTVSDIVYTVYGQIIGYSPGEQVTLNELLHGLLVYSGNDAAVCIAECVSGSVEVFVELMNSKAQELGMSNTHYINPHGLDEDDHYSTPFDLLTVARYAMQFPLFQSIVGSAYTVLDVAGEALTYFSTNEVMNYYPGVQGIKTGYTYEAGCCYVGVATRGDVTIYICVLGSETGSGRWSDAEVLFDWAFSHYGDTSLLTRTSPTLTTYNLFSSNPAWSVSYRYYIAPVFLSGEAHEIVTENMAGSLADLGEIGSRISWVGQDEILDASRISTAQAVSFETHAFGPLISELFY